MPGQPCDLLHRYALIAHHADKRRPQLLRHPPRPEPGRRGHPPEIPPQVMRLIPRPTEVVNTSPCSCQSATAFSTVYPCAVRSPASSSECKAFSLSLTSALVWPLTFRRRRLPSASNPSETTPRQRPVQVL